MDCSSHTDLRTRYLLLSGVVVLVAGLAAALLVPTGFPLDDAWIFMVFARNLGTSSEWSYNLGEVSAGITSPLWTLLLSLHSRLGLPIYESQYAALLALAGGILPLMLCLPGVIRPMLLGPQQYRHRLSLFLTFLTVSHGMVLFHVFSGMETALFLGLGLSVLVVSIRGHAWLTGLLLGLLVLTRFEGLVLGLVLGLYQILEGKSPKRNRVILGLLAGGLTGCTSLFLLNRVVGGSWLPATLSGRRFLYGLDPDEMPWETAGTHLHTMLTSWLERLHDWYWLDNFLPFQNLSIALGGVQIHLLAVLPALLAVAGLIVILLRMFEPRRWRGGQAFLLLMLWILGHNVFYLLVLPKAGHAGRYQAVNLLVIPTLVYFGWQWMTARWGVLKGRFPRTLSTSLVAGLLVCSWGTSLVVWKQVLWEGIGRINSLHLAMGRWASTHLPPDSRVVAFDLGGFKAASGLYVVDQSGLVQPRSLDSFKKHNSPVFYRQQQATHLFKFEQLDEPLLDVQPRWQTRFVALKTLQLEEEFGIDRQALQNTWSRCTLYELHFMEAEGSLDPAQLPLPKL